MKRSFHKHFLISFGYFFPLVAHYIRSSWSTIKWLSDTEENESQTPNLLHSRAGGPSTHPWVCLWGLCCLRGTSYSVYLFDHSKARPAGGSLEKPFSTTSRCPGCFSYSKETQLGLLILLICVSWLLTFLTPTSSDSTDSYTESHFGGAVPWKLLWS